MGHGLRGWCAAVCVAAIGLLLATPAAAQKKAKVATSVQAESFAVPGASAGWAPADIDSAVPPVDASATCALDKIVAAAGAKAEELISVLPQFTATEHMEHFEADAAGNWSKPKVVDFNYLVEMKKVRDRSLFMDELRDGHQSLDKFPAHIATLGLPAVAMVFHPFYVDGYAMKCEGLGTWDGRRAWQIRFQQRPDKFPRLRGYRVKDNTYGLRLKGRAWVDAETDEVLHIDTDLMEPVPQIQLLREHLSVDYRPVHFQKENEDLWLQQSAEVYMDFKGHRYHRKHTFTNFLLFSVDVNQTVTNPSGNQQ